MAALNTTVHGSSGTCVAVADSLSGLYAASQHADGAVRESSGRAEEDWHGPAHDEFAESLQRVPDELGELADRAYECEWALRAFAESLDKAVDAMNEALRVAREGQLRIDGPFIIAPQAPAEPAGVSGKCPPGMSGQALAQARGAVAEYRTAAEVYDARAAVYNTCKTLVEDARRIEEKAHHELRAKMGTIAEVSSNWVTIGTMAAARAVSSAAGMTNTRRLIITTTDRLLNEARFLTNWANGSVSSVNPLQQRVLDMAAEKARNATAYRTRVSEFAKWSSTVPQSAREVLTANPGGARPGGVLKSLPYLGGTLVVVNEAYGAYKGEQSWGKAAADSAATVGGSALGAAATTAGGAALMGSPLGPVGTVVLGSVGGIAGAIGGQVVADFFVPE